MAPSASTSAATATAEAMSSFDPLKGYTHSVAAPSDSRPSSSSTALNPGPPRADSRPAATQRPSSVRRRSSKRSARGDAEDSPGGAGGEDGDGPRTTRPPRGTTTTTSSSRRTAPSALRPRSVQPPKDPDLFDTDEAFQAHAEEERASGWHHLPLFLVGLPPLGALVHGRAENWSDAIILALVIFYLYQLIKVPWELYYASYARQVLPANLEPPSTASEPEDPEVAAQRAESALVLRRNELFALGSTLFVPVVGASLLHYARGLLSDPDRFINQFLIGLFAIASSVKPFLHFVKLVKRHSLYHQEIVHYPSSRVHQLQRRVDRLEKELAELSRTAVPLSTFQSLSSSLSSTLTPLQRQLRRQSLETQHAQLSSTERLSALAGAVDELCLAFQAQDDELHALRDVVAARGAAAEGRAARIGGAAAVLGSVVKHLVLYLATPAYAHALGHGEGEHGRHGVAWYALWPVTVPRAVVGWAVKGTAKGAVKALGWEEDAEALAAARGGGTGAGAGNGAGGKGAGRRRIAGAPAKAALAAQEETWTYSDEDESEDSQEEDEEDSGRVAPAAHARASAPAPVAAYAPSYSRPSIPTAFAGRRAAAPTFHSTTGMARSQRVAGAA